MRFGIFIFCGMIVACALSVQAVLIDGYAAVVDDRVITVGEVKSEMQRLNQDLFRNIQSGGNVPEEKLAELYEKALEELVARSLIIKEFQRMEDDEEVELPEDAVDKQIQDIVRRRFDGDRSKLRENLERSNLSFQEFKRIQRESMIVSIMSRQRFKGKASVAPGEIREYYAEHKEEYKTPAKSEISLVVLDAKDEDSAQQIEKAEDLLDQIRSGADFSEIAREESIGNKAEEGGYRGWIETKNLNKQLRKAIADMEPGEVSDLIKTENKIYILKLEDHKPVQYESLAELESDIRQRLLREEQNRMMDEWVEQLKRKHYVKKYPAPGLY